MEGNPKHPKVIKGESWAGSDSFILFIGYRDGWYPNVGHGSVGLRIAQKGWFR